MRVRTVEVPGELELVGPVLEHDACTAERLAVPIQEFPAERAADGKRGGGAVEGAVGARAIPGEPRRCLVHEFGGIVGHHVEVDGLRTVAGVHGEDGAGFVNVLVFVC